MAVSTGGLVFGTEGSDMKLEDIQIQDFGQVGEVCITKDDTLLLNGKGSTKDIDIRVDQIREAMEDTTSDYEKEKMQERMARLVWPSVFGLDFSEFYIILLIWIRFHLKNSNGILLLKLFCLIVGKKIVLVIEKKNLKFNTEDREFTKKFEITRTIYSNSDRSKQFLKWNAF